MVVRREVQEAVHRVEHLEVGGSGAVEEGLRGRQLVGAVLAVIAGSLSETPRGITAGWPVVLGLLTRRGRN